MPLIDHFMFYGIFALTGLTLIIIGVWAWVETSPLPLPRARSPKACSGQRRNRGVQKRSS